MLIWWRIVDLPASTETWTSDKRETPQDAVLDSAHVNFDTRQLFVLNITSVIAAGLSLVATIVAVASFLPMRRSFKHE
ncbi:hypothetical protein E4U21_006767 [Claviceps maximensis]|nr:hypothetical protein E4U21_006767 [Claviceps maximensis]